LLFVHSRWFVTFCFTRCGTTNDIYDTKSLFVIGIDVGDVFQYKFELNVIGLHRQFWNDIDYKVMGNSLLATSIVVTDRHDNARKPNGTLIYEGQGGNPSFGSYEAWTWE